MASDIVRIKMSNLLMRVAAGCFIAFVLVFAWIAVRRQLGGMIGEVMPSTDPSAQQMVPVALALSPDDPMTLWFAASVTGQSFTPEASERTISLLTDAVRSSPNDYRWWLELGRAREQAGQIDAAEAAFKRGVDLAPSYTYPHWQLGNFYIRHDRIADAKTQLRLATINNLVYREQVFALAWDYFDHDPAQVEELATPGADVYTTLASFYSQRGQPADALRIWNKLSDEEKTRYPQISFAITQGLFEKRFFPQALEFARQLKIDEDARAETVTNAGFEKMINRPDPVYFDWKFAKDGKIDVMSDGAVKHSGSKSLRMTFRTYDKPTLYTAGQNVVVTPGVRYTLSFWVRTEGLRSAGPPQIEIVNANDDRIIATSRPIPQGTNDWQQMTIDITAPENCNSIVIRTSRVFCGDGCPLVGTLWYDDFQLDKK